MYRRKRWLKKSKRNDNMFISLISLFALVCWTLGSIRSISRKPKLIHGCFLWRLFCTFPVAEPIEVMGVDGVCNIVSLYEPDDGRQVWRTSCAEDVMCGWRYVRRTLCVEGVIHFHCLWTSRSYGFVRQSGHWRHRRFDRCYPDCNNNIS